MGIPLMLCYLVLLAVLSVFNMGILGCKSIKALGGSLYDGIMSMTCVHECLISFRCFEKDFKGFWKQSGRSDMPRDGGFNFNLPPKRFYLNIYSGEFAVCLRCSRSELILIIWMSRPAIDGCVHHDRAFHSSNRCIKSV